MQKSSRKYPEDIYSSLITDLTKFFGYYLFRVIYFYRVFGLKNIPARGPVILAPNHVSYLDPPMVACLVKRPVFFMTWHRVFSIPIFSWYIRKMGATPVNLSVTADRRALEVALHLLRKNQVVCIFPEGGRSLTNELMPLKPGVARLAAKTGATIVPVWLDGTYDVWPRDKKLPTFFKKIHIHFLDPIDTNNQENPESKKLEEMQLMEEIKTALETKKRKLHEKTADN